MAKRSARRRSILAIGVTVAVLLAAGTGPATAQSGKTKAKVLFTQQDQLVMYSFTAPSTEQPLGGVLGAQTGTATGDVNGTSVVNFKLTFTSNPFVRPTTFDV